MENKLPNRKQPRMKYYDYSTPGKYFVTICTHNRQCIFKMSEITETGPHNGIIQTKPINDLYIVPPKTTENMIIEKWLNEMQNKYGVEIEQYIIMPDHIHFIVYISSEQETTQSLPKIIQWYKTMTTNEYIKNVKQGKAKPYSGKLWQKSYYEHIIRNETDYQETMKYILNNPIKWETEHT